MKLVRENINFERGLDPKQAMDTGLMSQLKKDIIRILRENFTEDTIDDVTINEKENYLSIEGIDIWYGPEKTEVSFMIEATVSPFQISCSWSAGYSHHDFGGNSFTVNSLKEFEEGEINRQTLYPIVSELYDIYTVRYREFEDDEENEEADEI